MSLTCVECLFWYCGAMPGGGPGCARFLQVFLSPVLFLQHTPASVVQHLLASNVSLADRLPYTNSPAYKPWLIPRNAWLTFPQENNQKSSEKKLPCLPIMSAIMFCVGK